MRRAPSSTGLILVLLVLVSLVGLLTGLLTHALVNRGAATAQARPTTTPSTHSGASATDTPVSITGATGTATAPAISGQFQLSVTVTPKRVTSGQQITITVNAFTPDTHAPISGLPCVLRAPVDGSPSLFSSWPAAQTTNANGVASWTLTTPSQPAGTYEVEAFARTSAWSFKSDSTVEVSAS